MAELMFHYSDKRKPAPRLIAPWVLQSIAVIWISMLATALVWAWLSWAPS